MKRTNKFVTLITLTFSSMLYYLMSSKSTLKINKFLVHSIEHINPQQTSADEQVEKTFVTEKVGKRVEAQRSASTNNNCSESFAQDNAGISRKPLIETNPKRFLVAMSHNGPTNQLMGLRDSIFLSILLNRTLVLPKFYKVKTEKTDGDDTVPPESRFDVESLSKLISFERNERLHSLCKDAGIEQLVTGRGCLFIENRVRTVRKVVEDLHMPFPITIDNKPNFVCPNGSASYQPILKNHNSSHKCIAFAFYGLGISESPSGVQQARQILDTFKETDSKPLLSNLNDKLVYSMGFASTGLPYIVKKLASKFANEFMNGKPWLAIHWRYNPDDWMVHCKNAKQETAEDDKHSYYDTCYKIENLNPSDMLHAGIKIVEEQTKKNKVNLQSIYFATPLNQPNVIADFEREYKRLRNANKTNITALTSTTLESFLDKHIDCITEQDKSILKDTLALVEMELCIQSTIFLHSVRSSWSGNVIKERKGKRYSTFDDSILSVAWQEHIKLNED